jgi:thiamine-monophosphate kinase
MFLKKNDRETITDIGEFGLIERIKKIAGRPNAGVVLGIGDDAAVIDVGTNRYLLVTTDILTEKIHFNLDYFSYYQLGWRSMAANLSDIAAMAGSPENAFVSVAIPKTTEITSIEELYRGMKDLADLYQVTIIGGDTTSSTSDLFLCITITGSVEKTHVTARSGAKINDTIYVTGSLGGSCAGMKLLNQIKSPEPAENSALKKKHLNPQPRIEEAQYLRQNISLHAMIDVSDGLASEINHICSSSAVGATILENTIPLADGTKEVAAALGEKPLSYALNGGEDYELIFTAGGEEVKAIKPEFEKKFGIPLTKIGYIVEAEKGVSLTLKNGKEAGLKPTSWDHFPEG